MLYIKYSANLKYFEKTDINNKSFSLLVKLLSDYITFLDNAEIGDEVKSHLDHTFKIVKPNINDFIDLMDRRCSILLKKGKKTFIKVVVK